jgi:hypothetical protein
VVYFSPFSLVIPSSLRSGDTTACGDRDFEIWGFYLLRPIAEAPKKKHSTTRKFLQPKMMANTQADGT